MRRKGTGPGRAAPAPPEHLTDFAVAMARAVQARSQEPSMRTAYYTEPPPVEANVLASMKDRRESYCLEAGCWRPAECTDPVPAGGNPVGRCGHPEQVRSGWRQYRGDDPAWADEA